MSALVVGGGAEAFRVKTVIPTITAGAYSANDDIGGLQTVSNFFQSPGQVARIENISYVDIDGQAVAFNFFFHKNPATIPADNAAWSVSDADAILIQGFSVTGTATPNLLTPSQTFYTGAPASILLPQNVSSVDRNLYFSLRTTGTPTYSTTSSLVFVFHYRLTEGFVV